MKTFNMIIVGLLTAYCIISGFTKLMLSTGDVELFGGVGFSETEIMLYGVVYLISGALLVFETTRKWAAVVLCFVFCGTGAVIFMSGNFVYGFASMTPLFMIFFILKEGFHLGEPDQEYTPQ